MCIVSWGGVLVLLTSTVSFASGDRAANLKSHGTLEYVNETQSVLLSAEDLNYLASECDKLEDTMDALTLQGNPNIKYTYHEHKTGDGIVHPADYVYAGYDNPGGCFQSSYHVHTSACKYKTWHTHERCHKVHLADGSSYTVHRCTPHSRHEGDTRNNRWKLSCPWREGEIEKAEIVFQPR